MRLLGWWWIEVVVGFGVEVRGLSSLKVALS